MRLSKQIYLNYWKQLKLFVDERGLDWRFYSFEGEAETVVKIGSPHHKICLALAGSDGKHPRPFISASFWIPDSKEAFMMLQSKRVEIEAEMGKVLEWDSKLGRKSCWIRLTVAMDLSLEKNWPASFEWFAENAGKIRDVCHRHLTFVGC
ncbi:MAG: DUF4268 domain-containing protein [Candidatus Omnitrophica bacterium]|nr:DUF4268 domain-containing protein [Candidatus Omnitrophota bacterium]